MLPHPFYPIVDAAAWVERLLPAGVRFVQLRVKDRPEAELAREVGRAQALAERAGAVLVVNDHWRLAIDMGCGFVHLGQEDLDAADLKAIRAAGLWLGVSTHDEAELERALALSPAYVALGPVYPTTLKQVAHPPQGLARVTAWKRRLGTVPLVAIGGLTLERARDVRAAGADGLAVATDLLGHPEPLARARAWLAALG